MVETKKKLVGIELSHQRAPLEIRERISFSKDELKAALRMLSSEMDEVFVISTCNRLAVYGLGHSATPLKAFFAPFGLEEHYFDVYESSLETSRHLFATASGLYSQALGESEILGQIRNAYTLAHEAGTLGPVLHELVTKALATGKRVRKETAIGRQSTSLSAISYDLIRSTYRHWKSLPILVLGTGEMSRLVLQLLVKKGAQNLFVASHTLDRAQAFAQEFGAEGVEIEELPHLLRQMQVIVGATQCPFPLFYKDELEKLDSQPLLIDLGMPRNFDVEIKSLPGAQLFDLDDLKNITSEAMEKRRKEIPQAMQIVDAQVEDFLCWLNTRRVSPIISSYYSKLEQIRQEELEWAVPKLGELNERQLEIIGQMASRLARRLSGKPIEGLRRFSQAPDQPQNPIDTFKELFGL